MTMRRVLSNIGNPLKQIEHTSEITGVMLGGRWLGRKELDRLAAFEGTLR